MDNYQRIKDLRISIHALVKRATQTVSVFFLLIRISIHALVKRATDGTATEAVTQSISIHALVKRATTDDRLSSSAVSFQSTPS